MKKILALLLAVAFLVTVFVFFVSLSPQGEEIEEGSREVSESVSEPESGNEKPAEVSENISELELVGDSGWISASIEITFE